MHEDIMYQFSYRKSNRGQRFLNYNEGCREGGGYGGRPFAKTNIFTIILWWRMYKTNKQKSYKCYIVCYFCLGSFLPFI